MIIALINWVKESEPNTRAPLVPHPSSTSPTESTSSGVSSQKSQHGWDEIMESLSLDGLIREAAEGTTSAGPSMKASTSVAPQKPTDLGTTLRTRRDVVVVAASNSTNTGTMMKRQLIEGDRNGLLSLSPSLSDRSNGVSWSDQVWYLIDARENIPIQLLVNFFCCKTHFNRREYIWEEQSKIINMNSV